MEQDSEAEVINRNKSIVRRIHQAWNQRGETHLPAELVSPGLVSHSAQPVTATRGPGPIQVMSEPALPKEAFPDQRFEEQMLIAEGDLVFVAWTVTGTHLGPLYGRES